MASSSDAVRNFVYDVHIGNLRQGWEIVQQLSAQELDSWERINARFPVRDLTGEEKWGEKDETQVVKFLKACPLLGDKLAAQLAAQAAMFVNSSPARALPRGHSTRVGSLRERINRLYLSEKLPSMLGSTFSAKSKYNTKNSLKLIPFEEATSRREFLA